MEQFFIILKQLFIFIFFGLVGMFCVNRRILDEPVLNSISKFIINITMPFMLICNVLTGPSLDDLILASPIFVVYFSCLIFLFLLNIVVARILKFDEKKSNMYKALATFANAGFIGIPLILALFGKEGGIFVSLTTIVDQLLLWTLGIKLTSSTNKFNLQNLKNFISPALIAIICSLVGVLVGFKVPKTVLLAMEPIGNMTPVLSMIYIGGLFCLSDIKKYVPIRNGYGNTFWLSSPCRQA